MNTNTNEINSIEFLTQIAHEAKVPFTIVSENDRFVLQMGNFRYVVIHGENRTVNLVHIFGHLLRKYSETKK